MLIDRRSTRLSLIVPCALKLRYLSSLPTANNFCLPQSKILCQVHRTKNALVVSPLSDLSPSQYFVLFFHPILNPLGPRVFTVLTLIDSASLSYHPCFRSYLPKKVYFGIDFCDYKACMFGELPLASYRIFHLHILIDF